VELLDPPKTGPITGNVVRRRGADPVVAFSAFRADALPAEEAVAAGGAEGGTGGGPAGVPPSEDMGGEQVLDWEAEREQRRVNARNQHHEGELDVSLEFRKKPPTPLEHTGDRVPWRPSYPLPQRGAVYVRNCLTEVDRSRREGRGPDHESHATGACILPKKVQPATRVVVRPPQAAPPPSYAIWVGNGLRLTATSPTKKPGNRGSRRTRGPAG
jgi:hypothetical protein